MNPPQPRLLTYGQVKRKIEACIDTGGDYTLRLWTTSNPPLLPKQYLPGKRRALYSAARVEELLNSTSAQAAP